MDIIKTTNFPTREVICNYCDSTYRVNPLDLHWGIECRKVNGAYWNCPCCGKDNYIYLPGKKRFFGLSFKFDVDKADDFEKLVWKLGQA